MNLYQTWLAVLRQHASEVALFCPESGQSYSFAQLAARVAEQQPRGKGEICIVTQEDGPLEMLAQILACWRDDVVVSLSERVGMERQPLQVKPPVGSVHLKMTSGSTGAVRWAAFSAAALAADVNQIVSTMKLPVREGCNLAVVSLAHSYGFSNLVLPLLLHGMPMVWVRDPLPATMERAWDLAGRKWARMVLPAVPAMWRAWHQVGLLETMQPEVAITAAAPWSLDMEQAIWQRWGLKVHNFYGATECGGIAYDRTAEPRALSNQVGQAMDGVRLSIAEDGCLRVESQAAALAYLDAKDGDVLGNATFQTTDLAKLEGDELLLLGRKSDSIHVAGRKVSPQQIEEILLKHEAVRHCVVFGVPSADAARIEEVVVCAHVDAAQCPEALRTDLMHQLQSWERPRDWWWTEELKPDARGKISRHYWRERYLEQRASRQAPLQHLAG